MLECTTLELVPSNMLKILVVLAAITCVYAALLRSPLDAKPEKFKDQKGCYIKEMDAVVPFGQSLSSNKQCQEYRCKDELVIIASCGAIDVKPPCTTVSDTSQPYPDCCPKKAC